MTNQPLFDIEVLLERAVNEPWGIRLPCDTAEEAEHLRRQLYAVRDRLRRVGNQRYDILKFRLVGDEVWPVKKEALDRRRPRMETLTDPEPLTHEDLERLPKPPYFNRWTRRRW